MANKGRPSLYKPEYCQALIDHMKQGNPFETFATVCNCGRRTLYQWEKEYPDFSQAKEKAFELCAQFYVDLGKAMATGRLTRIKSESVALDSEGKPIRDPKTGEIKMNREYEPATPNATAYIWLTKQILKWRDKQDVMVSGDGMGGPIRLQAVPSDQIEARLKTLIAEAIEAGDDIRKLLPENS